MAVTDAEPGTVTTRRYACPGTHAVSGPTVTAATGPVLQRTTAGAVAADDVDRRRLAGGLLDECHHAGWQVSEWLRQGDRSGSRERRRRGQDDLLRAGDVDLWWAKSAAGRCRWRRRARGVVGAGGGRSSVPETSWQQCVAAGEVVGVAPVPAAGMTSSVADDAGKVMLIDEEAAASACRTMWLRSAPL